MLILGLARKGSQTTVVIEGFQGDNSPRIGESYVYQGKTYTVTDVRKF